MTAQAIILMLVAMTIIWGGLAVSVTALVVRGRREEDEERAAAFALAHAHMREGGQADDAEPGSEPQES